jgi:hypothetical protein
LWLKVIILIEDAFLKKKKKLLEEWVSSYCFIRLNIYPSLAEAVPTRGFPKASG